MLLFIETQVIKNPIQAKMKNRFTVYRGEKVWLEGEGRKDVMAHHDSNSGLTLVLHSSSWPPTRPSKSDLLCSVSLRLFSKVCTINLFSCSAHLSFSVNSSCPFMFSQLRSFYHLWGWYTFFCIPCSSAIAVLVYLLQKLNLVTKLDSYQHARY